MPVFLKAFVTIGVSYYVNDAAETYVSRFHDFFVREFYIPETPLGPREQVAVGERDSRIPLAIA